MSLVSRNWLRAVGLAVLAAGMVVRAPAQSQPRGRAIEFSEPRSEAATTNLDQATVGKSSLRSLDQAVKKPFDVFNTQDAVSEIFTPQKRQVNQPPNLKSKKTREMIERRRNWVFLTPEEMNGVETPEEMMNVTEYDKDGMPKTKKTSLELYYERMRQAERGGRTNQVNNAGFAAADRNGDQDGKSGKGPDEDKYSNRSIFADKEPDAKRPAPSTDSVKAASAMPQTAERRFAEFFGFANPDVGEKPFEKNPAAEARMQEFRQLIQTHPPVSPSFAAPAPVTPTFSAPAFSPGSLPGGVFSPNPASVSPASGFSPFSTAPRQPAIAPALTPPPQPAYRAPTPIPAFQLPQRKY